MTKKSPRSAGKNVTPRRTSKRSGVAGQPPAAPAMQEMTVTFALKELKLLDERIGAGMMSAKFIRVRSKSTQAPGGLTKEVFDSKAQGAFDSLRALIKRRAQIKGALVVSNAVTMVTVAGEEMTVAQALERKRGGDHEQSLVEMLQSQHAQAVREEAEMRVKIERDAETRVNSFLGSAADKSASVDESTRDMRQTFVSLHEPVLDDPLKLVEKLDDFVNAQGEFMMQVDAALDEVNATTKLRVPASV